MPPVQGEKEGHFRFKDVLTNFLLPQYKLEAPGKKGPL